MSDLTTDDHGRPEPPTGGDEAETLLGFLEYQRATLTWKCQELGDEQLRIALPPSAMTLGGLLKHLAYVEDYWFTEVVGGQPAPEPWASADFDADPDWDWRSAGDDSGDHLRELWAERVERSRIVVAGEFGRLGGQALGEPHAAWGGRGQVSLRWVIVHMIEEYARHNGHADLLREAIDDETGE